MLYFQRIPFSDNLESTTSVVVPCGGPEKGAPYIDLALQYYIAWSSGTVGFNIERISDQPGARRREGCRIAPIISQKQTQ